MSVDREVERRMGLKQNGDPIEDPPAHPAGRDGSRDGSRDGLSTGMATMRVAVKTLHSKKVHRSVGALAGFASAMSVLVGMLAAHATPKGWARVSMALHMTKKPLILKLVPVITGVSVAIATAAGLLGFYLWVRAPDDSPEHKSDGET
jgi:hypothetical protein